MGRISLDHFSRVGNGVDCCDPAGLGIESIAAYCGSNTKRSQSRGYSYQVRLEYCSPGWLWKERSSYKGLCESRVPGPVRRDLLPVALMEVELTSSANKCVDLSTNGRLVLIVIPRKTDSAINACDTSRIVMRSTF